MDEFLLKREAHAKAKNDDWDANIRWLAFQILAPHLPKGAKIDSVFPKAVQGQKPKNAKELRERLLAAARASRDTGKQPKTKKPAA